MSAVGPGTVVGAVPTPASGLWPGARPAATTGALGAGGLLAAGGPARGPKLEAGNKLPSMLANAASELAATAVFVLSAFREGVPKMADPAPVMG